MKARLLWIAIATAIFVLITASLPGSDSVASYQVSEMHWIVGLLLFALGVFFAVNDDEELAFACTASVGGHFALMAVLGFELSFLAVISSVVSAILALVSIVGAGDLILNFIGHDRVRKVIWPSMVGAPTVPWVKTSAEVFGQAIALVARDAHASSRISICN